MKKSTQFRALGSLMFAHSCSCLLTLVSAFGCGSASDGDPVYEEPSQLDGSGGDAPQASGGSGGQNTTSATGGSNSTTGGFTAGTGGAAPEQCVGVPANPFENVPPNAPQVTEFRIAYVIKPRVDAPGYNYTMSDEEIDAGREAYGNTFPQMVWDHTEQAIKVDATVIVMPRVVESNAVTRGVSDRPGVWPPDMPSRDLEEYFGEFAQGFYDQVQNYNAIPDFQYVNSGWFETPASVSWSVLNKRTDIGYDQDALSGAWHEWLHGWETYYYGFSGYPQTAPESCVHCAADHGFTADSEELPYWNGWYKTIANGEKGLGFGPSAFALYGTPRSRFEDREPALSEGIFRIEARHSSRLLTVTGSPATTEQRVVQGSYGTGELAAERFELKATENGDFRIQSSGGKTLLRSTEAELVLGEPAEDENQFWSPRYVGFGHFALFHRCSGQVLSIDAHSLTLGATIGLTAYEGSRSQHFRLIRIEP